MKLKEYLDQSGRRYGHFADEIGVDAVTLSRWISGVHKPSDFNMDKITLATKGAVVREDWYK